MILCSETGVAIGQNERLTVDAADLEFLHTPEVLDIPGFKELRTASS